MGTDLVLYFCIGNIYEFIYCYAFDQDNKNQQELPWWSSGKDSVLPVQGRGLVPGQGTRTHKPQLTVCMPQLKIPHAATNTQCRQINKYLKISTNNQEKGK